MADNSTHPDIPNSSSTDDTQTLSPNADDAVLDTDLSTPASPSTDPDQAAGDTASPEFSDFEQSPDIPTPQDELATSTQSEINRNSSVQYEVDVKNYANYAKASESGYTPETEKSLNYAARSPLSRFLIDLPTVLTQPATFWKQQDAHPATTLQVHFPHLTILILLRALACYIGLAQDRTLTTGRILLQVATQSVFIILLIYVMSLLITGLTALNNSPVSFEKALRFVGYSITPMLVTGILSILPFKSLPVICDIVAGPWAFLIIGAGMLPYLKINPERAPALTGFFCGLLLCLWSLFPILLPLLI